MITSQEVTGLGLCASLDGALTLCRRRLDGEDLLLPVDYLNLALPVGGEVPDQLPELLHEVGWPVVAHTIDLNLTTGVDAEKLLGLCNTAQSLDIKFYEEDCGVWLWDNMFLAAHMLNPLQNKDTLNTTVRNIRACARRLGRPFHVENPPVYYAEGDIDMWTYMETIARESDCGIILDLGHMIGYLINTDSEVQVAPVEWEGWQYVREIHVSGFEIYQLRSLPMWLDRHNLPFNDLVLGWLEEILIKVRRPIAVSLECERAPEEVLAYNLRAVHSIMEKLS